MEEPPPPPPKITVLKIFSETNRVIKSQPRHHFSALAFLFLFPTSLTSLLLQYYSSSLKPHFLTLTQPDPTTIIVLALAAVIFNLVSSIFAVGSIIYTALHGFNGEPVDLKSALKSISTSFFPLLFTSLIVLFAISAVAFLYALVVIAVSPTSLYLIAFLTAIFFALVLYIQSNLYLVYAVVVDESKWGFEALKRSRALTKGKRMVALALVVIFSFYGLIFYWASTSLPISSRFSADDWLAFAALILGKSVFQTLCQLYNVVSTAVLYVYCNTGNEFSGEYFVLPVDDEKVAYVV